MRKLALPVLGAAVALALAVHPAMASTASASVPPIHLDPAAKHPGVLTRSPAASPSGKGFSIQVEAQTPCPKKLDQAAAALFDVSDPKHPKGLSAFHVDLAGSATRTWKGSLPVVGPKGEILPAGSHYVVAGVCGNAAGSKFFDYEVLPFTVTTPPTTTTIVQSPPTTTPPASGGSLPFTGSSTQHLGVIALLAIGAGLVAVLWSRRRIRA